MEALLVLFLIWHCLKLLIPWLVLGISFFIFIALSVRLLISTTEYLRKAIICYNNTYDRLPVSRYTQTFWEKIFDLRSSKGFYYRHPVANPRSLSPATNRAATGDRSISRSKV